MSKFAKIETLDNWVTYHHLSSTLGWPIDKIAYEMDLNERKLREWINERGTAMSELETGNPGTVSSIKERVSEQYQAKKPEADPMPNVDLRKVVKYMEQGLTITEMAGKLNVPRPDFVRWWTRNLPIINQKLPNRPDRWDS